MGFDIDSLVGKTAELEFTFAGETCMLHYDPSAITQERLVTAEKTDDGFMDFFCDVVVDWDVTKGGAKVPLRPDKLREVPVIFLRSAFWEVMKTSAAGELGKVSSNGSRRKVPQDRRPRTTASSRSRSTSTSPRGTS